LLVYLARAVPWRATTAVGVLLVGLLAALSIRVTVLWPLEGCTIGLLAGSAAWCFDEPAADIVDVAPRSLAWRTRVRTSGVAWLVLWWAGAVWLARTAFHGHAVAVFWHGVSATLLVTGVATWHRAAHVARPAAATASLVSSTAVLLALCRPYPRELPFFPYVYGGPWVAAAVWWGCAAALGAASLLLALVGPANPLANFRPGRNP
jgi:hypothetical protein